MRGLDWLSKIPKTPMLMQFLAAIKTHEELISKGYNSQVAIVAGKYGRGIEADEKIGFEIKSILNDYTADAAVLVSDGEDDEK